MNAYLSTISGMPGAGAWEQVLPLVFMLLLGLSLLAYVVLDGYDLGVGILFGAATPAEQDRMMASIGPFWDANETWLVLGIGLLLTAFPAAHGVVLSALYLPVALMLLGLILRGVAFDFRSKAPASQKALWSKTFQVGSLVTALSQGYMIGMYVLGLKGGLWNQVFALGVGISLAFGYVLMGSTWILMKCSDILKDKAKAWARAGLTGAAGGIAGLSVATPLASTAIFERWFSMPVFLYLCPIPLLTLVLFWKLHKALKAKTSLQSASAPFFLSTGILVLAFIGLAVSIFPFIVVNQLTVWQAAASTEALNAIALGAAIVLPAIIGYTCFVYWLFRGKTDEVAYP